MSLSAAVPRIGHVQRRVLGLITMFAATLAVMLGVAASAGATTIVSTSPSGPYATGASVTVSGTGVAGHYVAVTECNSTLGGLNGTYCNHTAPTTTAFKGVTIPANGQWSVTITVRKSFDNWNYSTNSANTGRTTCSGSTVCQIQASEYTSNPPTSAPVGTAAKTIAFT